MRRYRRVVSALAATGVTAESIGGWRAVSVVASGAGTVWAASRLLAPATSNTPPTMGATSAKLARPDVVAIPEY
jgi:hypothetical protein